MALHFWKHKVVHHVPCWVLVDSNQGAGYVNEAFYIHNNLEWLASDKSTLV